MVEGREMDQEAETVSRTSSKSRIYTPGEQPPVYLVYLMYLEYLVYLVYLVYLAVYLLTIYQGMTT